MTQGGSGGGFSSGDDFVAARVSIDVPTEGIQTLKEMSNAINNFRTAVETAGRGSSSFVGMLQQMTQAANMASEAHRNLSNQLQQTADMQQRMQTGGVGGAAQLPMSRNAPQGFVDNFAGMGIGMGSGGSRLSPSDVPSQLQSQQIDPTRQMDPRKYLEAQAGRNRTIGGIPTTPTGAPDWGAHADRVEQRDKQQREQEIKTPSGGGLGSLGRLGGLAGNMAAEMSVGGGSHAGMLGLAARGMGMIGHHIDASAGPGSVGADSAKAAMAFGAEKAEGMGIGSLVKGGAGALGIGLAGLGAVEKGGAMFQGYKNMGMIQGGGAGAGLQDEMQIRSMALNPFLTTEQSRQIVMAGLTEGYKGGQFDSVTQFIANNLKEMNLAQPANEQILTPAGWAKMGELVVGDRVIAGDGTATEVVKIFERGVNEVFEVKFADDTSTRCTMDHLWLIYQTNEKTPRVKFLKELVGARRKNSTGLLRTNGWPRYYIPLTQPVQFDRKRVPIDPYTLGILLGDGSFGHSHISVTCFEENFYDLVLPDGVVVKEEDRGRYRLTGNWNRWNRNPLMVALEGLGLGGITTHAKSIPEIYLQGSIGQRFALLQGLIDTDGHIDKNGIVFFTNASRQLINDVKALTLSLGGSVTIREVQPHQTTMKNGHIINSGLVYRMQLRLPGSLGAPCRIPRKAERYIPRMLTARKRTKAIVSVTKVGEEQCRCIRVAHPDQLYITSDYTVTHNSVADSVGVLRKNITEGGQSITGFNASMATLREMAKGGTQSLPDLQQRYLQTTQGLISNGVGGGRASEAALNAAESFGDDRMLAGSLGSTMSAISQNPMGGMMQMAFGGGPKAPPGLDPRMYGAWAAGHGGSPDQLSSNMIVRAVKQAFQNPASRQKGSGPWYTAVGRFQTYMMMWTGGNSPFGPEGQDVPKAEDMCEKVLSGQDPASSGKAKRDEVTQKVNVGSGGEGVFNSALGTIGSSIMDIGKMAIGGLTGNYGAADRAGDDMSKQWDVGNYEGAAQASNPVFENVVRAYGPNGIEVDAGQGFGKVTGHKDQMEALAAGKAKWRRKGDEGSGITLGQTPGELQSDFRTGGSGQGGGQTKVDFGPADVKISFGPQGQPTASPNPVRLTPNQQAANSGQGGASMNNPPPGDGYGYYPGRGQYFGHSQ